MSGSTLAARFAQLIDQSAADLQAAAGGGAVCVFSKAGTPVPGIKFAEGRSAALREVDRIARRSGNEVGTVAQQVRSTWSAELDRLTAREAGPDWIAYRTGGLDALDDLVAEPDRTGSPD